MLHDDLRNILAISLHSNCHVMAALGLWPWSVRIALTDVQNFSVKCSLDKSRIMSKELGINKLNVSEFSHCILLK